MSEQTPPQGQPQQQQVQVHVRDDKAATVYSNVARLGMGINAEELVIDFGISSQVPERQDAMLMDITARVFMNFYAAKRLALTLSQAVQRYEQQFGPLELDPRRRLKQG